MSSLTRNAELLKYCPQCGKTLDPPSLKKIHCSWCGFELYLNTAAACAALIVDEAGRVLLIERAREPGGGKLDLPGGFADPGESAEDAVRREIKEELDADVVSMRYFTSAPNEYEYKGITYATVDLAFVCELRDLSSLQLSEEGRAIVWMDLHDLDPDRIAFGSIRQILARYAAQTGTGR